MSHHAFRSVSVYGSGIVPFGKFPELSLSTLARPAVLDALRDSGIEHTKIQAFYCGSALSGMMSGQRIARETGLSGIPIVNSENACSSSATAFREAWIAVASGLIDFALVVGVESSPAWAAARCRWTRKTSK